MNKVLGFAVAAGLMLGTTAAEAATATGQFQVQLTILAACQVSNTNTLDFGSVGGWTSNLDATTTFQVQCTTGVPYSVGLDSGANAGLLGILGLTRNMKHSATATYVGYELYTDSNRLVPWLNIGGAPVSLVSGVGTGSPQTHTVYGRVPVQTVPGPGTYTDTITVTINY